MHRKDLGVWLTVCSHQRAHHVQALVAQIGYATWYVPHGQGAVYRYAGAEHVVECDQGVWRQQNVALADAFARDLPCVHVDDDLRRVHQVVWEDGRARRRPLVFAEGVRALLAALRATSYRLAGPASSGNLLNAKPGTPVSCRHFITNAWTVTLPTPLRYDGAAPLHEDFDFTLQHLATYGGVVRCNYILPTFDYGTLPGGCHDFRTAARRAASIAALKNKWPGCIVENPRRPGEILLARDLEAKLRALATP